MGGRPHVSSEIHELCFDIYATKGWSYARIAEWLLHNKGIACPDDPSRPVSRVSILNWIRKGSKELTKEQAYRRDVETMLAGRELDELKEILHDQRSMNLVTSFDDIVKFVETALKIRKERSITFGVHAPRQKEVTHHGDVELKGLDPLTERLLANLDQHVEEERKRNGRA